MNNDNEFKIVQSLERISFALDRIAKAMEEIQRNGL
jgi:hypothetical protein